MQEVSDNFELDYAQQCCWLRQLSGTVLPAWVAQILLIRFDGRNEDNYAEEDGLHAQCCTVFVSANIFTL